MSLFLSQSSVVTNKPLLNLVSPRAKTFEYGTMGHMALPCAIWKYGSLTDGIISGHGFVVSGTLFNGASGVVRYGLTSFIKGVDSSLCELGWPLNGRHPTSLLALTYRGD